MKKRRSARGMGLLLSLVLLSTVPRGLEAGKCTICSDLGEAGFPESYRTPLCALQLKHPEWQFEALNISQISREKGKNYDFPYVVEEEWRVEGRSLVAAGKAYAAYAQVGSDLYDSGFYRANREAVAYFMDPRNFLSDEGVFQFLNLSGGDEIPVSEVLITLQETIR